MFNDETIFLPPQALSERRQKQETANRGKKNVVVVELTVERIFQIMWTRCFSANWTKAVSLIKGSKSSYRSQLKSLFGSSKKKKKKKKESSNLWNDFYVTSKSNKAKSFIKWWWHAMENHFFNFSSTTTMITPSTDCHLPTRISSLELENFSAHFESEF